MVDIQGSIKYSFTITPKGYLYDGTKFIEWIGEGRYELIGTLGDVLNNEDLAVKTLYRSRIQDQLYYHDGIAKHVNIATDAFKHRLQVEGIDITNHNQLVILVVDDTITSMRKVKKPVAYKRHNKYIK